MTKRGRRSAQDLSVVVDISRRPPPPPPSDLSEAEAAIWRDAAGSMSSDWMTKAAHPVLSAYCRHACRAVTLQDQINAFDPKWTKRPGGLERLAKLLAMAERETRAMTATARALRLTPQARIQPVTAGRRVNNLPLTTQTPWD